MDWRVNDSFKLGVDFHNSEATSDPNDPVTGGGQTAFSFAGTNCPTTNPPGSYNATNGNPVIQYNNNYAVWQTPQRILEARLFRLSGQFDF
jgi:hypothetical protein